MKTRVLLLFAILASLVGCSREILQQQLVGSYILRESNATDRLRLFSNGTYEHIYKETNGNDVTASDKWSFEKIDGAPTVLLMNFRCPADGVNALGQGYFLMAVTSHWGRYRLSTDADKQVTYFEQIEEQKE